MKQYLPSLVHYPPIQWHTVFYMLTNCPYSTLINHDPMFLQLQPLLFLLLRVLLLPPLLLQVSHHLCHCHCIFLRVTFFQPTFTAFCPSYQGAAAATPAAATPAVAGATPAVVPPATPAAATPPAPAVATVTDSSALPPGDGLSSAAADAAAGKPGRAGARSAQGMGKPGASGLLGMGGPKAKGGPAGAKGGPGVPHLRGRA